MTVARPRPGSPCRTARRSCVPSRRRRAAAAGPTGGVRRSAVRPPGRMVPGAFRPHLSDVLARGERPSIGGPGLHRIARGLRKPANPNDGPASGSAPCTGGGAIRPAGSAGDRSGSVDSPRPRRGGGRPTLLERLPTRWPPLRSTRPRSTEKGGPSAASRCPIERGARRAGRPAPTADNRPEGTRSKGGPRPCHGSRLRRGDPPVPRCGSTGAPALVTGRFDRPDTARDHTRSDPPPTGYDPARIGRPGSFRREGRNRDGRGGLGCLGTTTGWPPSGRTDPRATRTDGRRSARRKAARGTAPGHRPRDGSALRWLDRAASRSKAPTTASAGDPSRTRAR